MYPLKDTKAPVNFFSARGYLKTSSSVGIVVIRDNI